MNRKVLSSLANGISMGKDDSLFVRTEQERMADLVSDQIAVVGAEMIHGFEQAKQAFVDQHAYVVKTFSFGGEVYRVRIEYGGAEYVSPIVQ